MKLLQASPEHVEAPGPGRAMHKFPEQASDPCTMHVRNKVSNPIRRALAMGRAGMSFNSKSDFKQSMKRALAMGRARMSSNAGETPASTNDGASPLLLL